MKKNSLCALLTVLVVDDDEFALELMQIQLEKCGFTSIHKASNGRTGLRALGQMVQPPDLLICDIFMPDMDGIEFVGELVKRQFQGALVLVSGGDKGMLSVAQQIAVAHGISVLGAFTKPLSTDTLAQALGLGTNDPV